MKVGVITTPNQKGQIVIPKEFRKALNIDERRPLQMVLRQGCIYLYPIAEVITDVEREQSYVEILKKTAGAWAGDKTWDKTRARRRRIELAASRRRKQVW